MTVRSHSLVPSTASMVIVGITEFTQTSLCGVLYNPYSGKRAAFADVLDFTNKLDSLFDEIAFPMAATRYRTFKPKNRKKRLEDMQFGTPQEGMESEMKKDMQPDPKDINTFVLHVKFRQNATWQGTVKWAGENQERSFRSTLELLKIMDSVMAESAPESAEEKSE